MGARPGGGGLAVEEVRQDLSCSVQAMETKSVGGAIRNPEEGEPPKDCSLASDIYWALGIYGLMLLGSPMRTVCGLAAPLHTDKTSQHPNSVVKFYNYNLPNLEPCYCPL